MLVFLLKNLFDIARLVLDFTEKIFLSRFKFFFVRG